MNRETVKTTGAPGAIGPYSQGVKCGGLVFCSGQLPIDPATGKMVEGGIREQTDRVLRNLQAVLSAGNSGLESVVKTTVYLIDMGEFPEMNDVYKSFFPGDPPARVTVQVSKLPAGSRVEIDAIGVAS